MHTSGHISVVCPAMLVYIVPYAGGQRLCFSTTASAGRHDDPRGPRGQAQPTIQSRHRLIEDPTAAQLVSSRLHMSLCLSRARGQRWVATYIWLDGRVRHVGIVGQVRRRRERAQRPLAYGSHARHSPLARCARGRASTVEERGGFQLDGMSFQFPRPGIWGLSAERPRTGPGKRRFLRLHHSRAQPTTMLHARPASSPPICHLSTDPPHSVSLSAFCASSRCPAAVAECPRACVTNALVNTPPDRPVPYFDMSRGTRHSVQHLMSCICAAMLPPVGSCSPTRRCTNCAARTQPRAEFGRWVLALTMTVR
jgi:hypothetical protein